MMITTRIQQAFSLIELMVVIVILGLLAAIALPNYQTFVNQARVAESSAQIETLRTDETVYYQESQVNSAGGYQQPNFYNVANPQPTPIPAQTKAVGVFTNAGWVAIRFSPTEALAFQYNVTAAGTGSSATCTLSATGDLKPGASTTQRAMLGSASTGPIWSQIIRLSDE